MRDDNFTQENRTGVLPGLERSQPLTAAPDPASGAWLLQKIGASVPRGWKPVAHRALNGLSACLPSGLRYRLVRLMRIMTSEMGAIERDYPSWIEQFDRMDDNKRRSITARVGHLSNRPVISVLMPVYNPDTERLLAAIRSVQDQLYPWWELCIADDASTDPAVLSTLHAAADQEDRIKLVRRDRNGHISAASNSALALATGDFVALLDHDDILPPHALYEIAARLQARPDADIIYSDEDHIDDHGRRSHPYFKPDWNHELVLGQNLISHLGVYRREILEKIGGFRVGLEGSQDYDLALRAVAETTADRILHIPKVLYHWRQGTGENTFSEAAQERCIQNGRRAVRDFITRDQPDARVEAARVVQGWTRVAYPLPPLPPLVSIVVSPATNDGMMSRCIDSLLSTTTYSTMEILLPSNAGVSLADPRMREATYSAARGDVVLFLDPAVAPQNSDWLAEMVSHGIRPDIGAVGARVMNRAGTILHAGLVLGGPNAVFAPYVGRQGSDAGYFGQLQLTREVTAVTGGCVMVRRELFLAAGGWDERLQTRMFRDLDLCLRLMQYGRRNIWTPYATMTRSDPEPAASAAERAIGETDLALIRQKWHGWFGADRYWSPNLAADASEVRLAFPPTGQQASVPE